MKRGAPIKRYTRLKPIRTSPRRSGRVRDRAYLEWLHTMPCYAAVWLGIEIEWAGASSNPEERAAAFEDIYQRRLAWTCQGRITADHVGPRPLGRKCSDREAIALCAYHHHCRQTYVGLWSRMKAPEMRAWADEAIAWTQLQWARHQDPDRELP